MPRAVAMLFAATVVARGQAVLLEPGNGEAGIRVKFALDAAQILVEFAIDQLQRGLHGHRAVIGFQHGLTAAVDAHARADSRLRHVGRGNVGLLQFLNCRRQFSFEGSNELGAADGLGTVFPLAADEHN